MALIHNKHGRPVSPGGSEKAATMSVSVRPPLLPPLPKSIATVSLSGTLPEKLDAAAAVGFDGVEIFERDLLTFDGLPRDVREIAEGLGLAITIFRVSP
jgi:hypothetical protein